MVSFSILLALCALIRWGGRALPAEKWQMLASVPVVRNADGTWQGCNLTWYGFFSALAYTLATATAVVLLASVGIGFWGLALMVGGMLGLCMPASKILARMVEGKPNTLSVGAAAFVGILIAPWIAGLTVWLTGTGSVLPMLAALAISYALGEGVGRLACLSFGCCYGRPIASLPEFWRKRFASWSIIFHGQTKKAAYAHDLCGVPLVPVQLMTAYLYCAAACLGIFFFTAGHFSLAMALPLAATQIWRTLSEFLRADYRGEQKFSAYQIMALVGLACGLLPALVLDTPQISPDMILGLSALWTAPMILLLQAVFIGVFLYTGRSMVTGAVLRFFVREKEI